MPLHEGSKKSSSLAHYMVQRLATELVACGALVIIVSVASRNSYKLFARLGFVPIDKLVLLNKYNKQILNMGLVLGAEHKSEFTEQFLFQSPVYIHENQKIEALYGFQTVSVAVD